MLRDLDAACCDSGVSEHPNKKLTIRRTLLALDETPLTNGNFHVPETSKVSVT